MVRGYKTSNPSWYRRTAKRWRNDLVRDALAVVDSALSPVLGKQAASRAVSSIMNRSDDMYDRKLSRAVGGRSRKRARTTTAGPSPGRVAATGVSKRYRTKGYGPRRLKRGTGRKIPRAAKSGVMQEREFGNVITDPDCVYVGHASIAPDELVRLFCYGIIRWLYNKADIGFTRWDDTDDIAHVISVTFRTSTQQPIQTFGTTITTTGLTYKLIALELQGILTDILALPGTVTEWDGINALIEQVSMTVTGIPISRFRFQQATFHYSVRSLLKIQNRTLADHDTTDGDQAQAARRTDHVENNPLIGYRYMCKGKGFLVREMVTNGQGPIEVGVGYGANNDSALITARYTDTQDSRKPLPPSSFHGYVKSKRVNVQPGEIVKDAIYDSMKMRANSFIGKFASWMHDPGEAYRREYRWYGKSSMVGLESAMNSSQTIEQPVSIGYQICRYTYAYFTHFENRVSMPVFESAADSTVVQRGGV